MKRASLTIYIFLIKYYQGDVNEVMSKKASSFKKLQKNIKRKMVVLPYVVYFKSLIVWIAYLLSFCS